MTESTLETLQRAAVEAVFVYLEHAVSVRRKMMTERFDENGVFAGYPEAYADTDIERAAAALAVLTEGGDKRL